MFQTAIVYLKFNSTIHYTLEVCALFLSIILHHIDPMSQMLVCCKCICYYCL